MFLEKGDFAPIDNDMNEEFSAVFKEFARLQKKHGMMDSDSAINEVRDSKVAMELDFNKINTNKHGMDAASSDGTRFLEVKQSSVSSKTWSGTWNDTNYEKAEIFTRPNVYTALAVWNDLDDMAFIVYGQNPELGKYLKEGVTRSIENSRRSTQTLGLTKLVNEYGFKIIAPAHKTKEEVYDVLSSRYKKIDDLVLLKDIEYFSELVH